MTASYFIRLTPSGIQKGPMELYEPDTSTQLLITAHPDEQKIVVFQDDNDKTGYTIHIPDLDSLDPEEYEPILRIVKKELNYSYIDEYLSSSSDSSSSSAATTSDSSTQYYASSELPSSAVITDTTDTSACDCADTTCDRKVDGVLIAQLVQDAIAGPETLAVLNRYIQNAISQHAPDDYVPRKHYESLKQQFDVLEIQVTRLAKTVNRLATALNITGVPVQNAQ